LHADFGQFLAYRQVALGSLVWLGWLGGDGVQGGAPWAGVVANGTRTQLGDVGKWFLTGKGAG